MGMNWTCPTCGQPTTIVNANYDRESFSINTSESKDNEQIEVVGVLIKCPNPECGAQKLTLAVRYQELTRNLAGQITTRRPGARNVGNGDYTIIPTTPRPLSSYCPDVVIKDFNEAWLILELSPKASATLARRALQGMVRHRWKVSLPKLHAELLTLKSHADPAVYDALMALKAVGNIGAHPERDISLIIDVESDEARELLEFLLLLDQEWYVIPAERIKRLTRIAGMKTTKDETRAALIAAASPVPPSEL